MKVLARLFVVVWVVSWTGNSFEPRPCEPSGPPPNPYTGQPSQEVYAAYCGGMVAREFKKRFDSKEEAQSFIAGCPQGECTDVKLESADE